MSTVKHQSRIEEFVAPYLGHFTFTSYIHVKRRSIFYEWGTLMAP